MKKLALARRACFKQIYKGFSVLSRVGLHFANRCLHFSCIFFFH